jgi:hypothetical protein
MTAATAAAKVLFRHEIVNSVYVRGSVAAGEVSFGSSDIDLTIMVRESSAEIGDVSEPVSLYRTVRGTAKTRKPEFLHPMTWPPRAAAGFGGACPDLYRALRQRVHGNDRQAKERSRVLEALL